MNIFNYRLVRRYALLAIIIVKLAREILELLNMAFNYLSRPHHHDYTATMEIKISDKKRLVGIRTDR